MSMELDDLRSFLILSEQLHFRRAAEMLHVSQPALSKQIRRLEDRMGGQLLIRRSRGLHLTAAGQVLLQHARHIIEDAESAERVTRLALKGEAGTLRVGFGVAVLARGLPNLMMRFRKRYPNVDLSVRNMSTSDQTQELCERKIDVGFVRLPIRAEEIATIPIVKERLMVVLSEQSAYDARKGLAGLRNAPFIIPCRADSASFYDHVFRTCRAAGFMPTVVQETDVFFTALNLVRAGLGVSIAPSAVQLMRVPQIRFAETRVPEGEWNIGIAWNRRNARSVLVKNFIAMARKHLSSTIK
ncbi:transcriptional regulator [Edaphobacter acidisoli]|uniref:Transcriptional regulator n=1 Tax=Edaphobacter acidisoli TaxID=2040573 RepID=A0A916W922_9BACT|nr:LysR family transcriptional regulator [Edaphobacter acidisoli]GGA77042.1 transcriptional regulator [Edaphobacter acidisoli]